MSCNKCSKPKPVVLVENPELINKEIKKLISDQLITADTSKTLIIANDSLFSTKFIIGFYKKNSFEAIWTNKGKLIKSGDTLVSVLKDADEYGLIANDYHISKIDSLIKTEKDSVTKKFDAVKLSELDILLTDAFFTFAVNIHKGRLNSDSLTREWKANQMEINLVTNLNSALKKNAIHLALDSLEPKNEQYQKLKIALKDFLFEFKDSNWDSLASRESDSLTFKERLKNRLIASHDYFKEFDGNDSIKLLKSIKNFQCKNNLTEDGKIGKLTFKALQRTKQDYIHQIEMNMERWRWQNAPNNKQFVWVNIPKYEMRVMEEDTLVMRSRVITGAPDHPTPLLKSTIRYFIIYPYWTVPFSIATKEILPTLKRDTSYLRRKNFDVLDGNNKVVDPKNINWKKYTKTYFPWRLRQRIGDDNSLGVLKFNFDNKYGVYLHDTDNHKLFNREMRAMSHGCVRLEKFLDFAHFLIRDDSIRYPFDSLKVDLLMDKQKYVYIKHPIPIYINYFTTEVDDNNELHFYIDVYKRDEKMLKFLYRK